MSTAFKRTLVTAALPYANGPKHIGHLAGAYLPADIYVRYKRMSGQEVAFICGSDEHGAAITIQALKEKTTPKAIVDQYHALLQEVFEKLGISFDIYHRTTAAIHKETAQAFFTNLYEKGALQEKSSEQYFDEEAGIFLADRYIKGTCPVCSHTEAYGDQCEKCGSSLSPQDLIAPVSTLTGKPPVLKTTVHWYLPLQNDESWLKDWILTRHAQDWRAHVLGQCKSWLESGLQPRAVTRDLDWGVPVPIEGAEGKVLYVWFDAPIGYISATRQWAADTGQNWETWWKSEDTRLVHFIGKDNIVFHCIIFPAMLKAHGQFILPDNVPANEFLNLEGDKMSTSRGWSIEMHEFLEDFPDRVDALRYYLAATFPENKDAEFTWREFQARYNNELADVLGNFVNRAVVLTQKFFEGKVPAKNLDFAPAQQLLDEARQTFDQAAQHLENFRFKAALQEIMALARSGNKFMADTEPWKRIKTNPDETAEILRVSLQVVAGLAILLEPFLPFTARKLQELLHLNNISWNPSQLGNFLPSGYALPEFPILFPKIDDETILRQLEKLKAKSALHHAPQGPAVALKPNISFDQFQAMDIRVATILKAQKVAGADKLLQLELDLGNGYKRTVVSGIALHFQPEDIIGKQVCYLANLEPRKIRGILSEGMILMAENLETKKLEFLSPSAPVTPGSTVS